MGYSEDPPLLVPFRMSTPRGELSLFTTLTTFGTPLDITLEELAVELFFPANDDSDQIRSRRVSIRRVIHQIRSKMGTIHPAGA